MLSYMGIPFDLARPCVVRDLFGSSAGLISNQTCWNNPCDEGWVERRETFSFGFVMLLGLILWLGLESLAVAYCQEDMLSLGCGWYKRGRSGSGSGSEEKSGKVAKVA